MKIKIGIVIVIFCALSLEAYKLSGKKWHGLHPVIKIEVDPMIQGMKSHLGYRLFLKEILLALREWNNKTDSHFDWKASGVPVPDTKSYFDLPELLKIATEQNKSACEVAKGNIGQLPIIISNENETDKDCTASSCTYIWSCGDEIIHADVTLNNSDFTWSDLVSNKDNLNIRTEVLKVAGQLAGLTSCAPGDTDLECNKMADPDAQSVLYKFPVFEKKEIISADDSNGIKALYGNFILPFPSSGPYALNEQERDIVQNLINIEYKLGYSKPEGRIQIAKQIDHLSKYSEYRSKKDLKKQYDEFMNAMQRQTATQSRDILKLQRDTLLMGIVTAVKTKEDVQNGYSSMDIGFIDYTINRHMELWRLTVDTIGGRQ